MSTSKVVLEGENSNWSFTEVGPYTEGVPRSSAVCFMGKNAVMLRHGKFVRLTFDGGVDAVIAKICRTILEADPDGRWTAKVVPGPAAIPMSQVRASDMVAPSASFTVSSGRGILS